MGLRITKTHPRPGWGGFGAELPFESIVSSKMKCSVGKGPVGKVKRVDRTLWTSIQNQKRESCFLFDQVISARKLS